MKQLIKWSVPAVAAMLIGFSATAGTITGTVNMGGTVTLNGNLSTATSASGFAGVIVSGGPTGSYAGTAGQPVTFNNFSWTRSPAGLVSAGSPLWSFSMGGTTYSFTLNNITSVTNPDPGDLIIKGNGVVDVTGLTETPAAWSFSITDVTGEGSNFTFGFSDSNTAVPDGGMTLALLGAAVTGLGLIKRKLA